MEIYDILKDDHDNLKKLLKEFVEEKKETKDYKTLVSQIRDELVPHSRAEEAVFYNSIRDLNGGKDIVAHSYQEHLAAETILRTLQAVQVFNAEGLGLAKKLKDALEHHISEEEGRVFEEARQLFSEEEAEEMGVAFQKMKSEVKGESIVGTTWDMVVNIMPHRLRKSFQKGKTMEHPH